MGGVQLLYTKWVTHSFSMVGCKYSNTYNFSLSTANNLIFPRSTASIKHLRTDHPEEMPLKGGPSNSVLTMVTFQALALEDLKYCMYSLTNVPIERSSIYRPLALLPARASERGNVIGLVSMYNWASEASPTTLGCSIEISRDI